MSKYLVIALLTFWATLASGATWTELGDPGKPNCQGDSCVVRQGSILFRVEMVLETQGNLTYLARLVIKNLASGKAQEFDTSEVSAIESNQRFKIYTIHLQNNVVNDLALFAFNSAKAGPAYSYFLFDDKNMKFIQNENTLAKLVWDRDKKTWKTEIQETPYRIENFKLKATGEPR